MTKTRHKRTAVASMFPNGISQNIKCAKRDGFHRAGHNYAGIIGGSLFATYLGHLAGDSYHFLLHHSAFIHGYWKKWWCPLIKL